MNSFFLISGSISGALAVALGAFGAHGLKAKLSPEMMAVYQTGVQYHFYHTFALLLIGVLLATKGAQPYLSTSGYLFLSGILLFSGSLYALALSGIKVLGAITPIGGLLFIGGWILLALAGTKLT